MNTAETILVIVLALYIVQALLKFVIHFLVPYPTRRKRIEATYRGGAISRADDGLLGLMVVLVVLLVVSGRTQPLSLITGFVVGQTLLQVYFHRFAAPLAREYAPDEPASPIKTMSFAIQANPRRAWKEYLFMTAVLIWGLYMLLAGAFGVG